MSEIEDVDQIRELDWCGFVVSELCEGVHKFMTSGVTYVYGCLAVLLLAYLHRFPYLGINEPVALPLVQHWPTEKLLGRVSAEKKNDQFGKSIMLSCYPITKPGVRVRVPLQLESSDEYINYPIPPDVRSSQEIQSTSKDVSVFLLCFL